jgi:hypothetical protein
MGDLWFIFVTRTQRDESPCSYKYCHHNQEYVLTVLYLIYYMQLSVFPGLFQIMKVIFF